MKINFGIFNLFIKWIPGELNTTIINAVNCTKRPFFPLWGKITQNASKVSQNILKELVS